MNWMYPGFRDGSRVQDRENFVILLKVFVNWKEKRDFLHSFLFFFSLGNANWIRQKRVSFNSYDQWENLGHQSVLKNNKNDFKIIVESLMNINISSSSYNVRAINQHLHFIHVMAYNYHDPWDSGKTIFLFFSKTSKCWNYFGVGALPFFFFLDETTRHIGHNAPLRMPPVNSRIVHSGSVVRFLFESILLFYIFPIGQSI